MIPEIGDMLLYLDSDKLSYGICTEILDPFIRAYWFNSTIVTVSTESFDAINRFKINFEVDSTTKK